jgi:hypothetical protein
MPFIPLVRVVRLCPTTQTLTKESTHSFPVYAALRPSYLSTLLLYASNMAEPGIEPEIPGHEPCELPLLHSATTIISRAKPQSKEGFLRLRLSYPGGVLPKAFGLVGSNGPTS